MAVASPMPDNTADTLSTVDISVCKSPIFVVGAPRSGTSMMQWALRQHPRLWGGPESDFLIALHTNALEAHALGSRRGKRHLLSGLGVTPEEFVRHVGYGLNSLYTSRSGGRRWVEQTPSYTLHMETMVQLFPGAVFLMMIRDGRQVVHSLRNFVNPMTHEEACETWKLYVETGLAFSRSNGSRVLPVRYEAVVDQPEESFKTVFRFLGEDYAQECVDFVRNKPINSSFNGQKPSDGLVPRWTEWTREEKVHFRNVAGELLIALGYEKHASWAD